MSSPLKRTTQILASEPFHLNINLFYSKQLCPLLSLCVPTQVSRGSKFHLTFSLCSLTLYCHWETFAVQRNFERNFEKCYQKMSATKHHEAHQRDGFKTTNHELVSSARTTQAVLKRCKVDHKLNKQLRAVHFSSFVSFLAMRYNLKAAAAASATRRWKFTLHITRVAAREVRCIERRNKRLDKWMKRARKRSNM